MTTLGDATAVTAPVTDRDVEFYNEHGYWVSPPMVPDDTLDAAERGMERFYAGDVDHVLEWDQRTDRDQNPPRDVQPLGLAPSTWRHHA